jgi:acyl-CoA-binding protein
MAKLKEQFEKAAEAVKQLPKRPDNTTLLKLYALYKQATLGDVRGERPGGLDFAERAKHDAWSKLKGVDQNDAMQGYIGMVESLLKR